MLSTTCRDTLSYKMEFLPMVDPRPRLVNNVLNSYHDHFIAIQLEKGKCLGQIDMGYSVISMQAERLRIDIDVGDQSFVYHLKVCNHFC